MTSVTMVIAVVVAMLVLVILLEVAFLERGVLTGDPCPSASAAPSQAPASTAPVPSPEKTAAGTPGAHPCSPATAATEQGQRLIADRSGFRLGAIEVLLGLLLLLLLVRIVLERRAPTVAVVSVTPDATVDAAVKGPIQAGLQQGLADAWLRPASLPSTGAVGQLATILKESGVAPAGVVGKAIDAVTGLLMPPVGYVATWSVDSRVASAVRISVIVTEAASGIVVGGRLSKAGSESDAIKSAVDAIWGLIWTNGPLLARTPRWSRWQATNGSTFRRFREAQSLEGGDLAAAIVEFREVVKDEPLNGDARIALGNALVRDAQVNDRAPAYLEAMEQYLTALIVSPDLFPARYRLAAAWTFVGEWAAAWLVCDQLRENLLKLIALHDSPIQGPLDTPEAVQAEFLALAERELDAVRNELGFWTVLWRWLGASDADSSTARSLIGFSRFSDRGRKQRLVTSALMITRIQRGPVVSGRGLVLQFRWLLWKEIIQPRHPTATPQELWNAFNRWELKLLTVFNGDWQIPYNQACGIARSIDELQPRNVAEVDVVRILRGLVSQADALPDRKLLQWVAWEDPDLEVLRRPLADGAVRPMVRFWQALGVEREPATSTSEAILRSIPWVGLAATSMVGRWESRGELISSTAAVDPVTLRAWFESEALAWSTISTWLKTPLDAATRMAMAAATGVDPGADPGRLGAEPGLSVARQATWSTIISAAKASDAAWVKRRDDLTSAVLDSAAVRDVRRSVAPALLARKRWELLLALATAPTDDAARHALEDNTA